MQLLSLPNYKYQLTEGKKVIGKVNLIPTGNRGWYLADLIIYKKHRGQGYGNTFMTEIFRLYKKKKKRSIFLWVGKNNRPAIKLYEKYGFRLKLDGDFLFYTYW